MQGVVSQIPMPVGTGRYSGLCALRDSLTMEQQQAEWVSAQAEELRVERERWSAALEASHRQIMHLTHKEAELEKCASSCLPSGPVGSPAGEPQP